MIDSPTTPHGSAPPRIERPAWFAVVAVALGIFALVTAEQFPVGILVQVSGALQVSEGVAALTVTMPCIVAAVTAPVLPIVARRVDRRTLLLGLMLLMVASAALSAAATGFATMLLARFLVGISIGGYWALAGGIALRLVPEALVGRATTIIFGGIAVASVLGIPLGALVGEAAGWRTAFLVLAGLGAIVAAAFVATLPSMPASEAVGLGELAALLRRRGIVVGLVVTGLIVLAQFAAFTFVSPALQRVIGLPAALVAPLLLVYGAAGLAGNVAGGAVAGRNPRLALIIIPLVLGGALLLLPLAGAQVGGWLWLVLWGLGYGGVSVSVQSFALRTAPDAPEAATSLLVAVFNFSIALGAAFGGLLVDRVGLVTPFVVGPGLLAVAAIVMLLAGRRARPPA